jgi:hypothetical protein
VNSQRCVNFFIAVDPNDAKAPLALYGTPGLKAFCELENEGANTCVRGAHEMKEVGYVIVGSNVYSVTTAGVKTLLGTISTSSGNVFMADNGTQILIVDESATAYYIEAGVLAAIADPDFPNPASATTYQDGYIVVTEKGTGKFYISGLYDVTTWNALDFATAEGDPDYALRVISANRELWVFGEKTVEAFWNSGNTDFPFERIQGSMIEQGIAAAASAVKIDGVFYWLTDKRKIVRNTGYQVQPISTPTVDYQLSTYNTVSDARGYTCTIEGHVWYVLAFPTEQKTWGYDLTTGYFFEWESYYNKDVSIPFGRHRSNCCVRLGGKEIVGDYENGKLYELDMNTYTDDGETIRRIRTAQFINKDRLNVQYHSFEIEFEAGVGLGTETAMTTACTVSIAIPGVVTAPGHGMEVGTDFTFSTTGALPTGITAGTTYYVISTGLADDTFQFSATDGGAAINTSGAQSGIHTLNWTLAVAPQACLDWSDDGGHTFLNEHWKSIGNIGEYKNRAIWRRCGQARSRTFRLTISEPVKVVILGSYGTLEALAA